MVATDVKPLAAAERNAFADLLETLTPEQWQARTLCDRWTVQQLVGHVVSYEELGRSALLRRYARALASRTSPNAVGVREYGDRSPDELVGLLRRHATPTGATAGFGGAIGLTDTTIHHQDVRRPLGLPRSIPPERLVPVLDFLPMALALPSWRNVRGIRLVATDLGWTHGNGPEVAGRAESILMAVSGRPIALADLSGPGLERLAARVKRHEKR